MPPTPLALLDIKKELKLIEVHNIALELGQTKTSKLKAHIPSIQNLLDKLEFDRDRERSRIFSEIKSIRSARQMNHDFKQEMVELYDALAKQQLSLEIELEELYQIQEEAIPNDP